MKEISEKSFKLIQSIGKTLKSDIEKDKKWRINPKNVTVLEHVNDGILVSNFKNKNGDFYSLIQAIDKDADYRIALNLVLIYDGDEGTTAHIDHWHINDTENSLSVADLYASTKKLLKLGRSGISKIVERNKKLAKQISNLYRKVDNF